jgi:hypothetical protein
MKYVGGQLRSSSRTYRHTFSQAKISGLCAKDVHQVLSVSHASSDRHAYTFGYLVDLARNLAGDKVTSGGSRICGEDYAISTSQRYRCRPFKIFLFFFQVYTSTE